MTKEELQEAIEVSGYCAKCSHFATCCNSAGDDNSPTHSVKVSVRSVMGVITVTQCEAKEVK